MSTVHFITLLLWISMLTLNTASQIFMKLVAVDLHGQTFGTSWLMLAAASPMLWAALACEGTNFVLWLAILKRHKLGIAFSLSSITYALVLLCSWAFLHEPIYPMQAAGTLLILAGIILIGQQEPSPEIHSQP